MRFSPLSAALTVALTVFTAVSAYDTRHARESVTHQHKRIAAAIAANNTLLNDNVPTKRATDGTKYVFMHHILGNTYSYTSDDWKNDIREIGAKGVDAIALNIGSSDWQPAQIKLAYQAAKDLGTGMKLFISFDFTEMSCDTAPVVAQVKAFSSHPNQFLVDGRPMISSYSGGCLGNAGWKTIKDQTNGYLMPFIYGLEGAFDSWTSLDSWYCWGCAWPQGDYTKNTDDDKYYIQQLGSRYAASVSGWMYAHYNYKNVYLKGEDWLINTRWEQLIAMRSELTFVEMETWNDYGESDYFGPMRGAQPAGTTWATNFPHTAWYDMSAYYIQAFKTGSYPAIKQDTIYFWARPHLTGAVATADTLGSPENAAWAKDTLWAAVFATSPATVTLQCGSNSQDFQVVAGVNKISLPAAVGTVTVKMTRNGQTIINHTPNDFQVVNAPAQYNFNAYVGSASA